MSACLEAVAEEAPTKAPEEYAWSDSTLEATPEDAAEGFAATGGGGSRRTGGAVVGRGRDARQAGDAGDAGCGSTEGATDGGT